MGWLIAWTDVSFSFILFCFYSREQPSKLDSDVLAAIEAEQIDPQKYPLIYKWKHAVQSYSSSDRQRYCCKANQMSHNTYGTNQAQVDFAPNAPFFMGALDQNCHGASQAPASSSWPFWRKLHLIN